MIRGILLSTTLLILTGCAIAPSNKDVSLEQPPIVQAPPLIEQLANVPPLDGEKIIVGVYSFEDKTGQRRPSDSGASLSSAVTQGAEVWVIDALLKVGNGAWFDVVERSGMDDIIKERQLVRSTQDNYDTEAVPLTPMVFAGVLLEGGIVGYDSNVMTGGTGARYFGIGAKEEYRVDTVTISMRLVSVQTGRILLSVATQKTIASHREGADVFKFLDMGTKALELETGFSVNEPVNYAVRAAIEAAVIELIYEGVRNELWSFR